mgnify:CR=1 FL=1
MATPTTLAELAPFWRADDNEGVSLESVSKEIAALAMKALAFFMSSLSLSSSCIVET